MLLCHTSTFRVGTGFSKEMPSWVMNIGTMSWCPVPYVMARSFLEEPAKNLGLHPGLVRTQAGSMLH